jgi:hypothetical protein
VEGKSSGGGCVFGEMLPAPVPRGGQRVPGGSRGGDGMPQVALACVERKERREGADGSILA